MLRHSQYISGKISQIDVPKYLAFSQKIDVQTFPILISGKISQIDVPKYLAFSQKIDVKTFPIYFWENKPN